MGKQMGKAWIIFSLLVLFSSAVSAAALTVSGASTIQPILEDLAGTYQSQTGIELAVVGGGSGRGISDVVAEISALGMVSRALSANEKNQVNSVVIGLDALVFIVNEQNPVHSLTKQQIIDIYSGKTTNWLELGGPDKPITLISKEVGRSTLDLFEDYAGLVSPSRGVSGNLIDKNAYEIGSNLEGVTLVAGLPYAIGYISYGSASILLEAGMKIKIVSLDGIILNRDVIVSRQYPISRELNLVFTNRTPSIDGLLALLHSDLGQRTISQHGFVPVGK